MEIQFISGALGLFIGLVMGLSGAGGSVLAIPLLVIVLDIEYTHAAPIALLAIMVAAMVGTTQGLIAGNVRYKTALLIGSFGLLLTPLGVWIATQIPTQLLSVALAVIMIYTAWHMWFQQAKEQLEYESSPAPPCQLNPATSKLFWTAFCTKRLLATGSLAGLLSGLLGVGGGFIIVPSLKKVSNFDFQTVIATSLCVITIVSAGSVIVYLYSGSIHWKIAIPFVIGTGCSMYISRLISHTIPAIINQRIFSILAVTAAILLVIKTTS